ncbi:MAG TPA: Crp/Fnr family transcriptional regulator [Candidatus Binataceae bacterium]|nr:Crp/Fnr family transcriptional regulator [Candidatus Binataceae bacterium]
MSRVQKRALIFGKKDAPESAYILLSGIARITCCNRKGERVLVIMIAPGMIPGVPPTVTGIRYDFRCEAVTDCQIGTAPLMTFIEIALGISSVPFKKMAASYNGRWDLVQLRCSNFMACTLEERLALILLELCENFGVREKRGVRLGVSARHKDLAQLVGASRPRVTEYLASFERHDMISREGRELVVKRGRLESFLEGHHLAVDGSDSAASAAP